MSTCPQDDKSNTRRRTPHGGARRWLLPQLVFAHREFTGFTGLTHHEGPDPLRIRAFVFQ
ncbi:protein of unknown function [Streptomyces murinus]